MQQSERVLVSCNFVLFQVFFFVPLSSFSLCNSNFSDYCLYLLVFPTSLYKSTKHNIRKLLSTFRQMCATKQCGKQEGVQFETDYETRNANKNNLYICIHFYYKYYGGGEIIAEIQQEICNILFRTPSSIIIITLYSLALLL